MAQKKFKAWNGFAKETTNIESIDKYLEDEKNANAIEPWSKLDKTTKIRKLIAFAEEYKTLNGLTEEQHSNLVSFFRDCLDKKRLHKVKDVIYNKDTGEVTDVPGLTLNPTTHNYSLKVVEKQRVSTLKGKGGSQKRKISGGTVKNKHVKATDSEDEEEEVLKNET
jgi:hypothetical protein